MIADSSVLQPLDKGVLVLCGGTIWESADAPDLLQILHESRARGSTIAGICGATLALARAGMLDTIQHTSNGPDYL